jgi:hypothetical protein
VLTNKELQKLEEKKNMEEAQRASSIFPNGRFLQPNEDEQQGKPDFLLHTDNGEIFGIEITELCEKKPREEKGKLAKVPNEALNSYNKS